MCRASLTDTSYVTRPARKVHVDLSNCEGETSGDRPRSHRTHRSKRLEQRLAAETLEGHRLDVHSAAHLADEVGKFLKKQSSNEVYLSMFLLLQHCGMMSF